MICSLEKIKNTVSGNLDSNQSLFLNYKFNIQHFFNFIIKLA